MKWGNVKQKPLRQIQAYSGVFRHMKAYSDIIRHIQAYSSRFRNYSDISLTLCNPDKFRTLVCSESWYIQNQRHIQNPGIFKNLVQSEPETYIQNREIFRTGGISELCQTSTMERFKKQLTAIIFFAISTFHVFYFMK